MTLRDTRVIAKLTAIFANCEKLPAEMSGFVSFMENELRSIEQKLSAEFDLSPVWRAIGSLKEAVADLENAMENQKHTDDVISAGSFSQLAKMAVNFAMTLVSRSVTSGSTLSKVSSFVCHQENIL